MALASTVAGAGHQVSKDTDTVVYYLISATGIKAKITVAKTTTVTVWPAITKAAGDTWVADTGSFVAGESRRSYEDNRVVGSYVAEQTIESKTVTKEIV